MVGSMSGCNQMCGQSCDCVDTNLQERIAKAKADYEAGNYYPPTPDDEIPLAPWEAIAIYGCILFFSLISLACIAAGAGAIYQHFFN